MFATQKKFAVLDYVKTMDEVPVKLGIIKKSPAKFKDFYIANFNPFLLSGIEIFEAAGFNIKLPITKEAAEADANKAEAVILRTAASLRDMGVDIAVFPKGYEVNAGTACGIYAADGKSLAPFFIVAAVEKAVKLAGKSMAAAEILIIGAAAETEAFIQNLYADVNYISLMAEEPEAYERLAAEVFEESGLNIQLFDFNKPAIASADIIINLISKEALGSREANASLDYVFKRGAVFFDFSMNKSRLDELIRKRGDMLVIDGLRLRRGELYLPLETAEAAFYARSSDYRRFFASACNPRFAKEIKRQLSRLDVSFAAFSQKGRALGAAQLTEFLKRAGLG